MAKVMIEGTDLVVHLSLLEKLGSLRGDVRVPLSAVRDAHAVSDPSAWMRGIRAPGTGIPGVLSLCTTRGSFGKDFVVVYGHRHGVVVDLEGVEFQRLVLSVPNGEDLARQLEPPL